MQSVHAAPPRPPLAVNAVNSSSSQPTPAPSAAPDSSRPAITQAAVSAVSPAGQTGSGVTPNTSIASGTGPRREIFGYATSGSLADPTIGYPSWNFNLLSTVAFFSIHVTYNGVLVADSDWSVWDSTTLTGLVSTAHAHGVKVVVSIKTLYGPGDTIDFCDTLYNAQTTVDQIVNQVKLKGIDGVNIDYEGQLFNCTNNDPTLNATSQVLMTQFAAKMRAGLDNYKKGLYLSIATYSGSALGNDGFFNISNINQYVDSFFVMAYDMDAANLPYPPLSCTGFCMNPVSPLANYYWNDTASMTSYSAVVGAGKTILGQPYYGRVACVASPVEHATSTGWFASASYTEAAGVPSSPDVQTGTFATHRDSSDPAGMDRWDTWYDLKLGCWREMDWSDTATLAVRYQMVNQMNLRGVGFWTLNYGGSSPELWTAIQTYFDGCYSVAVSTSPPTSSVVGTSVTVSASAGCPDANPLYHFNVMAPGAGTYQTVQDYSTSSSLTWNTNGLTIGTYRFSVWARDANSTGEFGNSTGTWDAYNNNTTYGLTACTGVNVSVTPTSPVGIGKTVTVTALASGCPDPNPVYHFSVMAPGATTYQMVQDYSTSPSFSWNTMGLAPGTYRFSVWARDASSSGAYGNSSGRWDAYDNSTLYSLTTCSAVAVSVAPGSAVGVGGTVTLTAQASGCPNPNPLYHFNLMAPGSTTYQMVQDYSTSPTFTWNTTGLAPGTYRFSVWARDASSSGAYGNSAGTWDVYNNNTTYTLTTCLAVSVTVSPASPRAAGTTVTVTANASGCPDANPLYHFSVMAPGGTTYTVVQNYSTSASFTWNTTGLAPGIYRFSVWARDANSSGAYGNGDGRWDVYNNNVTFSIS